MDQNSELRGMLQKLLDWEDAHVSFDSAVEGVPPEVRGVQPQGLPHSLWQLLEHTRICQRDILDFCRDPDYKEPKFEDYWPSTSMPPTEDGWEKSIVSFRADREHLKKLATNRSIDLFAPIPHGGGQTYLRELLLVADHNAYHVGQMVAVRRLLGNWKS
ncbi:MAG TPA: DinB family protein [Pyrinomonadaceae bacterium]|nr:DinB family protein [Pyrinomonadaceae bacterium]